MNLFSQNIYASVKKVVIFVVYTDLVFLQDESKWIWAKKLTEILTSFEKVMLAFYLNHIYNILFLYPHLFSL